MLYCQSEKLTTGWLESEEEVIEKGCYRNDLKHRKMSNFTTIQPQCCSSCCFPQIYILWQHAAKAQVEGRHSDSGIHSHRRRCRPLLSPLPLAEIMLPR